VRPREGSAAAPAQKSDSILQLERLGHLPHVGDRPFFEGHCFALGALIISQKSILMPDPESILYPNPRSLTIFWAMMYADKK
jgi:hypothetical protein